MSDLKTYIRKRSYGPRICGRVRRRIPEVQDRGYPERSTEGGGDDTRGARPPD